MLFADGAGYSDCFIEVANNDKFRDINLYIDRHSLGEISRHQVSDDARGSDLLFSNEALRQADNGSCGADGLVLLKNALLMDDAISKLKKVPPSEDFKDKDLIAERRSFETCFLPEDLLQSAQSMRYVEKSMADMNAPLETSKNKTKTLQEKFLSHEREFEYRDDYEGATTILSENAYLYDKGHTFLQRVRQFVIENDDEVLREIYRCVSCKLILQEAGTKTPEPVLHGGALGFAASATASTGKSPT